MWLTCDAQLAVEWGQSQSREQAFPHKHARSAMAHITVVLPTWGIGTLTHAILVCHHAGDRYVVVGWRGALCTWVAQWLDTVGLMLEMNSNDVVWADVLRVATSIKVMWL